MSLIQKGKSLTRDSRKYSKGLLLMMFHGNEVRHLSSLINLGIAVVVSTIILSESFFTEGYHSSSCSSQEKNAFNKDVLVEN